MFNVRLAGNRHCHGNGFAEDVLTLATSVVPGTAAIRRRRQSMKPQVEVKSMNHRPAADCAPCRRYSST